LAGLRIQTNLPTPSKMVLAFECKVFTPDAFVPCKGLQHPLFYLELVKFRSALSEITFIRVKEVLIVTKHIHLFSRTIK